MNNPNQGIPEVESKELSAREIFKRILKGEVVRIPNDATLAAQLKNHLNVIKSREKKLFTSLGLDWISAVLKFSDVTAPIPANCFSGLTGYTIVAIDISLTAPKQRRKYPAFTIQTSANTEKNNDAASAITT